jgi:hypothetical protein
MRLKDATISPIPSNRALFSVNGNSNMAIIVIYRLYHVN